MKNKKITLNKIISLFLITIGVLIIGLRSNIVCSDALWHIKNGEWIMHNGIPHTVYGTIHENLSFMAHEWLFDIMAYGTDLLLGYRGLTIISVLLYVIGFSIMTFYSKENRIEKAFLVFLFGFLGFSKVVMAIPDTIGAILIITSNFVWLSKLNIKKKVIINILYTIVIVNLHGASLTAYLVQIGLFLFVDVMYLIYKKQSVVWKDYLLLFSTSLASGLINPYGFKVYNYAFHMLSAEISEFMVDWQPFCFRGIGGIAVFIFCMIFMFTGNKNLKELKKEDVIRYGIICLWLMMTFRYQRCINLLCYSLIAFGGNWIAFGLKGMCKMFNFKKIAITALSLLAIILSASFINKNNYSSTSEYVGQTFSKEALEHLHADGKTVFNYTNLGGYLIYSDVDVFIDGRTDPYIKSFNGKKDIVWEHLRACFYPDYMEQLVLEYGFTDIVLENNTVSSELYKQAGYKEVYSDDNIIIFSAKTPSQSDVCIDNKEK